MTEFDRDSKAATLRWVDRLNEILDEVARCDTNVILERFHYSLIAVGANPATFDKIEKRCFTMDCKVIALTLPDEKLMSRSLYRAEYEGADWQSFCERYGSEKAAMAALRRSQMVRLEHIRTGSLPHVAIDTSGKKWQRYAAAIAMWTNWSKPSSFD